MTAKEKRNYIRLFNLINVANRVLVHVLRSRFPLNLCYVSILKQNEQKLQRHVKHDTYLLQTLYPQDGDYKGDFSELDITNVCTLLRYIGQIATFDEWNKEPEDTDRSMRANISRIKNIRNKHFHSSNITVKDEEFEACWEELRQCILQLGNNDYIKEIDDLYNCPIDRELRDILENLKEKEDYWICHLGTATPYCCNNKIDGNSIENIRILELKQESLKKWRKETESFVETSESNVIKDIIKQNQVIVIQGGPGCGKTVTVLHTAFQLEKEDGYTICISDKPKEILKFTAEDGRTIFLFDDIFGKFGLNTKCLNKWKDKESISYVNGMLKKYQKLKLIITCRSQTETQSIFRNIGNGAYFHQMNLDMDDKKMIAKQYYKNCPNDLFTGLYANLSFFPLLCKKHSSENCRNAKNLKECVHAIMSADFTQLQNNGPLPVLAFGLLILFDNFVKKELFKDKWEDTEKVISTLMKECSNNYKPSQNDILSTFNDLEGTYLIENEVSFKAINSIIYDCIVSNVGRHFFGSILALAADSFLMERIKFESLRLEDKFNSILLPQILEKKYFNRIVILLQHGKLKEAFSNVQSNDTEYRSKFINYCRISETDLSRFTESADGCSFLHVCAKFGFADIARFILQNNNGIVGKTDNYGETPLQVACVYGFREIVNVLLEYKSDIHITDNNTLTPLHLCCKHGHAELVELLIHEGADISLCSAKQGTPIFIAVHNNCLDVIHVLLRNNADANNGSESGKTPLHDACENNRTDIVNILVDQKKAGVDINKSDKDGRTPLYITCQKGYIDLAEILIFNKHGKASINKADVNGLAPIHIAVSEKHFNVTELLLRKKAAVEKRSKQGHTPLYYACENGSIDIVKLLLSYQADINGKNEMCSRTPLYKAYEHEHYNIVKCLLEQETAIRLSNYKYMFLFTACLMGDVNAVKDLLQNKKIFFNLNYIKYGETVLSIASKKGFPKLVELLLQYNPDINFHSKTGWTALCLACKSGSKNTVELLLKHKASVHIATKSRITALFISCLYSHSHLIEPLIHHGANVDEGDHHGWTPLKISCYLGDTEMVKILLKCKAKLDSEEEVRWKGERKTHIKIKRKNHIPHMVIEHKRKVHNYFKIKQTPLCISCAQGDETTVDELIDAGADINQGGETGDFASTLEACDKYVESRLKLSQISSKEKFDETEKLTALQIACYKRHTDVVKHLLKSKAAVNIFSPKGIVTKDVLSHKRFLEIMQKKMDTSPPVTPLNIAVQTIKN